MADSDFQSERPRPRRRPPAKRPPRVDRDDVFEDDDDDDDPVQILIPYKNVRALAAYYVGVASLIPGFGLFLGPAAIVLGVLGYRYGLAHPASKGTGHAAAGVVFGVIGTLINVVLAAFVYGIVTLRIRL